MLDTLSNHLKANGRGASSLQKHFEEDKNLEYIFLRDPSYHNGLGRKPRFFGQSGGYHRKEKALKCAVKCR